MNAALMAATHAQGWRLGLNTLFWIGPVVMFLALAGWLALTAFGAVRTRHVSPGCEPAPERGPVKGGFQKSSHGMFSHSYAPDQIPVSPEEEARSDPDRSHRYGTTVKQRRG
ncbi:hypothetical protein BTM25_00990 [Actinomadura rubteroloni]|uniref:Uncharacterized protein n=1 Tax=Actinomadura rubteroloni TaxID=1926885 RepID=A0A2P4UKY8_9ACTN|nr:hypothetical protein [Actinomadura rubteroloni]POM25716.1 hypothetical protein BTM25_00990 [Actinomadura rubteroloni]